MIQPDPALVTLLEATVAAGASDLPSALVARQLPAATECSWLSKVSKNSIQRRLSAS